MTILEEIKSAIDAMAMEGRVPTEIVISDRFKDEAEGTVKDIVTVKKFTTLFGVPFRWENLQREVYFYITTEEER